MKLVIVGWAERSGRLQESRGLAEFWLQLGNRGPT